MPLIKAIEDLRETTLGSLRGRWLKLLYFAKLRGKSPTKYSHWGFESKHGKHAEPALRQAHASVYREVLRAPIPELLQDCEENKAGDALLKEDSTETMVPIASEGQSESHFRYVFASVKALLQARKKQP